MKAVNALLQIPVRWLVPLLLAVLALLASGVNYGVKIRHQLDERTQAEERLLRERLSLEQTRLDVQSGAGDRLLVRRLVTGLGLFRGLDIAYLVQPDGRVTASLSRLDLGRPLADVPGEWPVHLVQWSADARPSAGIQIQRLPERSRLLGALAVQDGSRLLVSVDLSQALAEQVFAARQELLRESVVILSIAGVLALLLHLVWFRRASQLAGSLGRMGSGELSARTGLQGRDELARIGAAADRMAERLQAEQAETRHLSELVNRSPLVVIEWRNAPGWPVCFVSDSVAQWGYTPAELLGGQHSYNDLLHPDDVQRINDDIVQHFEHGPDDYRQEYRLRCKDGRWVWVDDRTALTRGPTGEVTGISGILLDISLQKEAQQAQREQAEQLRMFYELPFLGMAISSPVDKRWLQVNDRLCEILGYSRAELLRMSWADMTPPGDLERNVQLFDELLAGQRTSYAMQKRFIRKDGGVVHAEIDVRAGRDSDGRVKQLFATIQDVTERRQAEAALQNSERQLREAQRIGRMGSWAHDLRSGEVTWSEETYRLQDLDPETFRPSYDNFRSLIHPDDVARVVEAYQRSVEQGTVYETRYRIRVASGRIKHLHVRGETLMEDGQPARTVGMVVDETDLTEAQQERDRLASILEATTDIVSMADPQGNILYFNRAGRVMLDLENGTSLAVAASRLHPQWAADRILQEGLPAAIEHGVWSGETAVLNREGEVVPVSQVILSHRDDRGHLLYLSTIMRDLSERKRSEAALQEQEALLAEAQEVARLGNWNLDLMTGQALWSAEEYRLLGYEPGAVEPTLEHFMQAVHPEDRERVQRAMQQAMLAPGDRTYHVEHRVLQGTGVRHLEQRGRVSFDEQERAVRMFGTTMDVTERKQAEAALRQSEERYMLAARIGGSGAWEMWPAEGRIFFDGNLTRLMGFEAHELSEDLADWVDTVPEQARAEVAAAIQSVIHGRSDSYEIEHPVRRKDGSIGWVFVQGQCVSAPGEVPLRLVGSSLDITERKRADQALLDLKEMLEQAEVVARLGSWAYDSDTRYLRWSPQMFRNMHMPWSETPPSIDAYCERIHPDDVARVRTAIDLLVTAQDVPTVAFRTHPAFGPVHWMRRTVHRIPRDAEGRGPRYIGILLDITEAVEAEERLSRLNQELERRVAERTEQLSVANRELEAFSYTVSHDLKAPLRGIDGYSQLLVEEYGARLDDDGRLFVQRIRQGVQQMVELISDLLEYSRMERRDMAQEPVALQPLIEQILDSYHADIEQQGTQVRLSLEPVTLPLDREGISVVLRNLIGNALKFSRGSAAPAIEVGVRTEAGRRILWVRDNGVGFDMKYHDRIFGIFQRLHRPEEFPGTGVGLALVAKAVQRMGGRVWAESALGAGATFYLEFPV